MENVKRGMKPKTIKKVLDLKFKDWMESIQDAGVRKLVAENSIITGGCIASMVAGDKVNDYDIYFTNKETVLAVAKYYADQSSTRATVVDFDHLKDYPTDGEISKEYAINHGMAGEGRVAIYCDGMKQVKDEDIEDPDITNALELDTVKEAVETLSPLGKYNLQFISPNAITLSHKVQVIIRFYGDAKDIHKNYDFVHCTNYWVSYNEKKQSELVMNLDAYKSIAAKQLIYVGSKYPLASILRTKKFLLRGWTCDAGQYLKMILQCGQLDLTDIAVLEDQLVGVDVAYFMMLISSIRNAKKAHEDDNTWSLTSEYLIPIIDKIFDNG